MTVITDAIQAYVIEAASNNVTYLEIGAYDAAIQINVEDSSDR